MSITPRNIHLWRIFSFRYKNIKKQQLFANFILLYKFNIQPFRYISSELDTNFRGLILLNNGQIVGLETEFMK